MIKFGNGLLSITDEIGGDGHDEVPDLSSLTANDSLTITIDSFGGDFFFGRALYDALRKCPAKKTAVVTTAMSAATMPMCACDSIILETDGVVMIHGVSACGVMSLTQAEAGRLAGELDATNGLLARIYSSATKGKTSADEFRRLMDAETYLDGASLLRLGFPVLVQTAEMQASRKREMAHGIAVRACATWSNIMANKISAEAVEGEKRKAPPAATDDESATEPAPEQAEEVEAEAKPIMDEAAVRAIVTAVLAEMGVAPAKQEEEEKKPAPAPAEEEERKPEEDVEARVASALTAERERVTHLLAYSKLCDVSGYISGGKSVSDLAADRLAAEMATIGERKNALKNAMDNEPLAATAAPQKKSHLSADDIMALYNSSKHNVRR